MHLQTPKVSAPRLNSAFYRTKQLCLVNNDGIKFTCPFILTELRELVLVKGSDKIVKEVLKMSPNLAMLTIEPPSGTIDLQLHPGLRVVYIK